MTAPSLSAAFQPKPLLAGKNIVIFGVANEASIASGIAEVVAEQGGKIALICQNQKTIDRFAKPVIDKTHPDVVMACDVSNPEELRAVVDALKEKWGKVDGIVHSIAGGASLQALQGRVIDCPEEDFVRAMAISVHSLSKIVKEFEPVLANGASITTMSYDGANHITDGYGVMGACKAALEANVRYMADELGSKGIRVNTVSPGPIPTRAGGALKGFDNLLDLAAKNAPMLRLATPRDVGGTVAFLMSDLTGGISAQNVQVDCGLSSEGPGNHHVAAPTAPAA